MIYPVYTVIDVIVARYGKKMRADATMASALIFSNADSGCEW
jgi:hypothetical protein